MKRIFAFIITVILILTCASCSRNTITKAEPNLNVCFTCEASVSVGNELNAAATVKRCGNGVWEVEFSEPESLAGVKLAFADGEAEASYKGLSFSMPQSALPIKSMLSNLMNAVDGIAQSEQIEGTADGDALKINGRIDAGDYTVKLNLETGQLVSFEMPNFELVMEFTNMVCEAEQTTPAENAGTMETTALQETTAAAETPAA